MNSYNLEVIVKMRNLKSPKLVFFFRFAFLYVDNSDPKLRKKRKMSKSAKTKNEYYDAL